MAKGRYFQLWKPEIALLTAYLGWAVSLIFNGRVNLAVHRNNQLLSDIEWFSQENSAMETSRLPDF